MKIINVQALKKHCGSEVSNSKDRNKATLLGDNPDEKKDIYGYPLADDCYETYSSKRLKKDFLYNGNNELGEPLYTAYNSNSRFVSSGWGLVNEYDGSGFSKVVKLDHNNPLNKNFFYELIKKELIDSEWIEMDSTLALLFIFNIYNPNYHMAQEKRFLIEFLETGGLINMEHGATMVNAKLYRTTWISV